MKFLHLLTWSFGLFFFAATPSAFSQQEFLLRGVVKERGTNTRIQNAQVINKRNGYTVFTSDLGLFQLKSAVGDSLLVIKKDYSDGEAGVFTTADLTIYLNRGATLEEVKIVGQTKKQELNDIKREFRNKGSFYQGKPPLLAYIFQPLTAMYELFGRTPKNARRFGRYYDNEIKQSQVDGVFNEALIQSHTDLKGKELEDFMLNYRPEYEKTQNWAEYDAIKYIRDSYKKYKDSLKKNP
ncbi:hypothetical protein [Pedobacter gandavensis]|uniref:Carboxypeptidase-like regulatory domain-containing protein n=1 Tax=Pedobacter gandavensis TaxID=2679963 RepID=A0ABR6EYC7_9SPHI|nr:hypothetical protein [Pedobacter gandavensis]MBB2150273.1 hypothetical protein [Pedobacter gandavensis]